MLAKWKLELISFLSSLTLISVGFSSWNISSSLPVTQTVDGTVQADYVIKTDEYISLDFITPPEYNEDGFIVQDANIDGGFNSSYSSEIVVLKFTVKVDAFKSETSPFYLAQDNYLQIYCSVSFLEKQTEADSLFTFTRLTTTPKYQIVNNSTFHIYNYPIETITAQETNYTIELKFKIATKNSTDKNKIFNVLNGNKFVFDTKIYGTKEEVTVSN